MSSVFQTQQRHSSTTTEIGVRPTLMPARASFLPDANKETHLAAVPPLITTREAARRLGVSHGRVRQLVTAGDLPSVKIGRSRYVQEGDVRAYQPRKVGRPLGSVLYKIDVLGRRRRIKRQRQPEARAS